MVEFVISNVLYELKKLELYELENHALCFIFHINF